ncbi:hypothetical protein D3C76_1146460 [compost metagenome]
MMPVKMGYMGKTQGVKASPSPSAKKAAMLSQKPWLPRAAASLSCWLLAGASMASAEPVCPVSPVAARGCTGIRLSVGG